MSAHNYVQEHLNDTLTEAYLPELGDVYRGKVRENYILGDKRIIIASDRISAFDVILGRGVPFKGQLLCQLATFWFDKTKDIIPNHMLETPDPNVVVGKQGNVYPVEMIVRQYLVGSGWRSYQRCGEVCGVKLPDGLKEGDKLPECILTPTTKAAHGHDEEISREDIIEQGIVDKKIYEQMEQAALSLFERGTQHLSDCGTTLVDTKYEFADVNGTLTIVDEIHTPDSSRFWTEGHKDQDKEYLRRWLREDKNYMGDGPIPELPDDILVELASRYIGMYERITGTTFAPEAWPIKQRLVHNMKRAGYLTGCQVVLLMASKQDAEHVEKIVGHLKKLNIPARIRVASAHKTPAELLATIEAYERSVEPIVYITCAGRSDALSGMVSSNSRFPVISCPPNYNPTDIFSSLRSPSYACNMVVVSPENAALAAAKIFGAPGIEATMHEYKQVIRDLDAEYQK
jgi:fusion protein PurCD